MLKRNKVYVKLHNLKNIVRNNEVMKFKKKIIKNTFNRIKVYLFVFLLAIPYTIHPPNQISQ